MPIFRYPFSEPATSASLRVQYPTRSESGCCHWPTARYRRSPWSPKQAPLPNCVQSFGYATRKPVGSWYHLQLSGGANPGDGPGVPGAREALPTTGDASPHTAGNPGPLGRPVSKMITTTAEAAIATATPAAAHRAFGEAQRERVAPLGGGRPGPGTAGGRVGLGAGGAPENGCAEAGGAPSNGCAENGCTEAGGAPETGAENGCADTGGAPETGAENGCAEAGGALRTGPPEIGAAGGEGGGESG